MYREYVTLLQSLHRGTLSIQWYIAQSSILPLPCLSFLDALLRLPSLTDSLRWLWQRQTYLSIYIYIYYNNS